MPPAALTVPKAKARWLADACYLGLCLIGWAVVTLACVAALWLLFFVLLGNFSFSGTVLQVENFTSRYVAAASDRQDRFRSFFWLTSAGLFLAVGFFRRHALIGLRASATPSPEETIHG